MRFCCGGAAVTYDCFPSNSAAASDVDKRQIFKKALDFRNARIYECDDYEEFKKKVKDGGFFLCHWDGTEETEAKIKEETQATIRCVPYMFEQTPGTDMVSGKPAKYRVLIARSY